MERLFAAKLGSGNCAKIFSDGNDQIQQLSDSYETFDINNEIEYKSNKNIESDECFFIEPNEKQKQTMLDVYVNAIQNTAKLNCINSTDYNDIEALFLIEKKEDKNQDSNGTDDLKRINYNINIKFSRIFPRLKIETRRFLTLESDPSIISHNYSIELLNKIDAFWNGEKLFFKSYSTIRSLFPGIEDFYIIATKEEKNDFLNNGLFDFPNGMENLKVKERNLKRIAFLVRKKKIDFSNNEERKKYIEYAKKYSLKLKFTNTNKIELSANPDLTKAIQIIEENYYTSEITKVPMEAEISKLLSETS